MSVKEEQVSDFINFTTSEEPSQNAKKSMSTVGKVLFGLTGGVAIGLTVISVPFISPALRKFCLPYIPATNIQLKNILKALEGRSGTLLDLGSGDGRIVIETAKKNFKSDGVELNPWLVLYSKIDAFRNGLNNATKFYRKDLWKYNISKYDNVVIFGVEQMMADLEKKIINECQKNCHIIACRFPLPNKTPIRTIGSGIDTTSKHEEHKERKIQQQQQQFEYIEKSDKKERAPKLKEKREKLSEEEKEIRKQERKLGRKRDRGDDPQQAELKRRREEEKAAKLLVHSNGDFVESPHVREKHHRSREISPLYQNRERSHDRIEGREKHSRRNPENKRR